MKEETPYDYDKEFLETAANLKLSMGFKEMMMNAAELKWVELPDCPEKLTHDIALTFRDNSATPENGSVATCKPRIKNTDKTPIWEPKAKKNATAANAVRSNSTGNSTRNGSNRTNATAANATRANASNATASLS